MNIDRNKKQDRKIIENSTISPKTSNTRTILQFTNGKKPTIRTLKKKIYIYLGFKEREKNN